MVIQKLIEASANVNIESSMLPLRLAVMATAIYHDNFALLLQHGARCPSKDGSWKPDFDRPL